VDGEKVYVSNRGCNNLAVFSHREGKLSQPVFVDAEGIGPRDFYVYGGFLFCANEGSDCVSVFTCQNGQLRSQNLHLQIPKPLCVAIG
jgi:6-phosphogluconolactonase (cycloisomerase 2 family)